MMMTMMMRRRRRRKRKRSRRRHDNDDDDDDDGVNLSKGALDHRMCLQPGSTGLYVVERRVHFKGSRLVLAEQVACKSEVGVIHLTPWLTRTYVPTSLSSSVGLIFIPGGRVQELLPTQSGE